MNKQSQPDPSCLDESEPDFIKIDKARDAVFAAAPPLPGHEYLSLQESLGRVVSEDIAAQIDVPRQNNSAMDGYALHTSGAGARAGARYREVGVALAGQPYAGELNEGECVRITTGAWVPHGADTVIIQERSHSDGDAIVSVDNVEPGMNLRLAGEDIKAGGVIIAHGTRLWPAHVGLLGSLGIAELAVTREPRVAYFSTGDEVRGLGDPLSEGAIYDSNRHTVAAMLKRAGIEVIDFGVVADDPQAMHETLVAARDVADVIITSGGVSVGEADFIKPALAKLGDTRFWKVAVRPGRPFTFGLLGSVLFFGLPGNPVAAMVMFYQLVQPSLRHLSGERARLPQEMLAVCDSRLRKRPGRMEYQRGILSHDATGELRVAKTGMQGSGILSSMAAANCFIVLDEDTGNVEPGVRVRIQPFYGLM
ncbi:MAG: molybdopterin-binding protein [Gammaproteobacteria bacterium]|nr:molybdopterin-binding protein [Gammaproteobacteria bacterium]